MLATDGFEETQFVVLVTHNAEPSSYSAYPKSCSFAPVAMVGAIWDIEKAVRVPLDPFTSKVVTEENPLNDAVIFTLPGDFPATCPGLVSPLLCTEATAGLEDDHVADPLTSLLVPSLYPAVAVNCFVAPTLTDVAVGDSETDETTGFDPPPPPPPGV